MKSSAHEDAIFVTSLLAFFHFNYFLTNTLVYPDIQQKTISRIRHYQQHYCCPFVLMLIIKDILNSKIFSS
jgi:hypothetical protein